MTFNRALAIVTAISIASAFYFAGMARQSQFELAQAQSTLAKATVIQHEGNGEWVEVVHHGEVVSEWQPSDGEVYEVLDSALHGG